MHLIFFSLSWLAFIYCLNSAIARKFKRISWPVALVYITSVALIGIFGEVFVGSIYHALFDVPLWEYRVLPIHQGYTSHYSPVIWGLYGFHLYLLHDTLRAYNSSSKKLSLLFSVEATAMEIVFNLSYLIIFGEYLFYYFPSDLWHLTSLQTIPFYFLTGMTIVRTVKRFKTDPRFFILMNIMLIFVLATLT